MVGDPIREMYIIELGGLVGLLGYVNNKGKVSRFDLVSLLLSGFWFVRDSPFRV